jgi:hypothetical protein
MESWREDLARIIMVGAVLGITAGAVVWFLERFESDRLHEEVARYLRDYDAFNEWLAHRGTETA